MDRNIGLLINDKRNILKKFARGNESYRRAVLETN
jgi:hypothetical protein